MITIENVSFAYPSMDIEPRYALRNVNLDIQENEFIAFLGPNGSGKSSLSKLLNGIEQPTEGAIGVDGLSVAEGSSIRAVRKKVQIVFQNPENQQVGVTVGEDIAFGLSNMGWARETMSSRISWALKTVGLDVDEDRLVTQLSGGEKQKLALAAVLAIDPEYLILDEATSMLDPTGRRQFLCSLAEARRTKSFAVIYVTHHMEEVMDADRWVLFSGGSIRAVGRPDELWRQQDLLRDCGLELPYRHRLTLELERRGIPANAIDSLLNGGTRDAD
ncbi:ATP-binding cassette domain-containing protein [Cohnella cholangitidis]|uniref:ATP-binding cassette domain-containing protein n=1 Tax=Cohnella cholangitidis TaxID=2598458 RepID=A0A7G5C4Q3_9BACL|nr:ATP-binding cassette domain-containing protein [Cohnella cholangitidis]QMV44187.1 ATP-binding cassette domain-containing protein [Cohnella cholangitidis]